MSSPICHTIVTTRTEIKNSPIFRGQLQAVQEVLGEENSRVVYLEELTNPDEIAGERVINIGIHFFLPMDRERSELACEALRRCHSIVSLHDDHETPPYTQMRQAVQGKPNRAVAHFPRPSGRLWAWAESWSSVQLCALQYRPSQVLTPPARPAELVYYGSFRAGRRRLINRYFNTEQYHTTVYTFSRRVKEDWEGYVSFATALKDKMPDFEELRKYSATIYMSEFVGDNGFGLSPANRFYEALSVGVPIFFDADALVHFDDMREKYGWDFKNPWVVTRPDDIARVFRKPGDLELMQLDQFRDLRRPYRDDALAELEEAIFW